MKITAITPQKNKNFYNLFTDGEFLCSVDDELIVIHHLHVGKEVDGEYLQTVKKEAALRKAFHLSLHYLSYKMRTEQEIREYLLNKEFEENIITSTVEKLKYYKYIDDENYIVLYINSKIAEGHSKAKIQYQLLQKGLNEESVLSQLDHNYPKETELVYLKEQIEKSNEKYKDYPYRDRVTKISQAFLRKGYHYEDINSIINHIISRETSENVGFQSRLEKLAIKYVEKHQKKGCEWKEAKYKATQELYRKGYEMEQINKYFNSKEDE